MKSIRDVEQEINYYGKYQWLKQVGKGGQGVVCKARDIKTGEFVAIKVMNREALKHAPDAQYSKQRILTEIINHKRLTGHPLIIDFREVFQTKSFLCIVMQFAKGGDMYSYLMGCDHYGVPLTEDESRAWFQQLIMAVHFSHQMNIVNRDIKLENILLVQNSKQTLRKWWGQNHKFAPEYNKLWHLKLCDFGYSKDILHNQLLRSQVGTALYASPDVLFSESQTGYDGRKQDIWSCGITLYILLCNRYPFDPKDTHINEKMKNGIFSFPEHAQISYNAKHLICGMLAANPSRRFTIQDVIQHPWFQKNLPRNWQLDFGEHVKQVQEQLQSDQEIKLLIDNVFA
eukprot:TRINITY_DN6592_c0_g2_i1.p1 TRINITY_DN6592_c0_g2~~TRINITY_DN6592_c0_g2_i1.p1  ORF type:complete len:343 (-),score=29.22 TRINITY_DN6592_c0_g2_i1:1206-2234(-)